MKCMRNEVKIGSNRTNIKEKSVETASRGGFNKKTVLDNF